MSEFEIRVVLVEKVRSVIGAAREIEHEKVTIHASDLRDAQNVMHTIRKECDYR